jgi:hypothetical protein
MAGTTFTLKTDVVLDQDAASSLLETLKSVSKEYLLYAVVPNTDDLLGGIVITPPKETVIIRQDSDGGYDPLDCDEPFIMYCEHPRYILGHKDAQNPFEENDEGVWIRRPEVLGLLPLYLYDHSGITMRTGPFDCKWDSGQVGWIYYTQESLDACGCKAEGMTRIMADFVKNTYAPYLEGQVFYFAVVDEDGTITDNCGGFVGYKLEDTGILDYIQSELHESAKAAWETRYEDR